MSQVLKALQKSQQEYEQAQKAHTPVTGRPGVAKNDTLSSWLLVGAVGVLIGASVKFYLPQLGSPVDAFTYKTLDSILVPPQVSKVLPIEQEPLKLTFLDGESSLELKPLPRPIPATVSATAPDELIQTTPKAEPVQNDSSQNVEWNLSQLDLSGLSPELASQVSSILKESPTTPDEEREQERQDQSLTELETHTQEYQGKLPPLNLQTHMYASNPSHRWVKINGEELQEGSSTKSGVKLMEIAPRYVVIEYRGEKLKVPALYDWAG